MLLWLLQVACEAEVVSAFTEAKQLSDHFIFIEVLVDKHDAAPAAAALRQGMSRHFNPLSGYTHLNMNASMAGGSSLTAGHDGCVSAGTEVGGEGDRGGQHTSPAPSGATAGAGGLGVVPGAALGTGVQLGGSLQTLKVKGTMHPAAGSSTCLASVGAADGLAAEGSPHALGVGGAGGLGRAGSVGVVGGVGGEGARHGASRLGLVPAKRPAEAEAGDSG